MFSLLVYALSILAGVLLWSDRQYGIGMSLFIQGIQIPYLVSPILTYLVYAGMKLAVLVSGLRLEFEYHLGSGWYISVLEEDARWAFGVNVFAILMIVALVRAKAKICHDTPAT